MRLRAVEVLLLVVIAALLFGIFTERASPAAAPPATLLFGDGDHNGQVDFNDITAALSNWLAGVQLAPGEVPPPPPMLLSAWADEFVKAIHPMAIEELESPEFTMVIVSGRAGEHAYRMGRDPRVVLGMKGRCWPGGAPPWPPPGSALEELMEAWAANAGAWNQEEVEAAAQAVVNQLLAQRAAAQRKAKP